MPLGYACKKVFDLFLITAIYKNQTSNVLISKYANNADLSRKNIKKYGNKIIEFEPIIVKYDEIGKNLKIFSEMRLLLSKNKFFGVLFK